MAAGLRCWDAQGRLILDVTDRMGRFVGQVSTGGAAGQIVDAGLGTGTPFFHLILQPGQQEGYALVNGAVVTRWRPTVTFSGTTMSWSEGVPSLITYGVW